MQWISSTEQMRRADAYAAESMKVPSLLLMEAAAKSVADRLVELVDKENDDILFLCGSGNNGGDGFACARMMKHKGYSVRVFYAGSEESLRGDAKTNFDMLSAYSVPLLTMSQGSAFNHIADQSEWVVDALFGTGLDRNISGHLSPIVNIINDLREKGRFKVLSIDIPSGISGDTGKMLGCAVKADETVTFCRLKPGLLLYPGCDYAGRVTVTDIGIPDSVPSLKEASFFRLEKEDLKKLIPGRKSRSHKGLYGRVLAVSGSKSMTGCAVFCVSSAYRSGCGLVECAIVEASAGILMSQVPECITTPYREGDLSWIEKSTAGASVVLVGPGLSTAPYAVDVMKEILEKTDKKKTLVLDADALNILAASEEMRTMIKKRGNAILTPHMMEASRLLKKPVGTIMENPVENARELAERFGAVAVLKDALTIAAEPKAGGRVFFNSTGNNGMSTAGSGDVLAGLIAGLSAQGMQAFEAACTGVYLHGMAGDAAAREVGQYSMTAGDILRNINIDRLMEA